MPRPADQQPPTVPTGYDALTLEDAARRLGVSENAIVQRRKRGTIIATQTAGRWLYHVPPIGATDQQPPASRSASAGRRDQTDRDALAPLLSDLVQQVAMLSATNATLAERNRVLTDRLAALEAGPIAATASPITPTGEAHIAEHGLGREISDAETRDQPDAMPDKAARPERSPRSFRERVARAVAALGGRD